jgi:hypothetical protein
LKDLCNARRIYCSQQAHIARVVSDPEFARLG